MFLAQVGAQPNWRVLDMGCGTGGFVLEAAKSCSQVLAVEPSQAMLDLSIQKARAAGLRNITFIKAGFLTYAHEGPLLDAAFTMAALHHLPDFWKSVALRKLSASLKPGGKFYLADVVFSFKPEDYMEAFDSEMQAFAKHVDAEFLEQIRVDLCKEYMTYAWAIERMLTEAGLRIDEVSYPSRMFARYICTKCT